MRPHTNSPTASKEFPSNKIHEIKSRIRFYKKSREGEKGVQEV